MRILFWNMNENKGIGDYLVSLVSDYAVDTLVLAECSLPYDHLENILRPTGRGLHRCSTFGCARIHVLSNYVDVQPSVQARQYSIQIFQGNLILCGVHLSSDLHGSRSEERGITAGRIVHDMEDAGKRMKLDCLIVMGDFNATPYSSECLGAHTFHGLPTLDKGEKPVRTVDGIEYTKFYNPMWNLLGDFTYPAGTYYRNVSKLTTPRWYMLDQIILSRGAVSRFVKESLQIITACKYGNLADANGRPNRDISDHFPIVCELTDGQMEGEP